MKRILNSKTLTAAVTLLVGLFLGWLIFAPGHSSEDRDTDSDAVQATVWTCSMHPSVRQPAPGKCPICGMDLIPLDQDAGLEDNKMISMSPTAIKLANIQTMIVGGEVGEKAVRLNGKVQADERRVSSQTAHVPGRIEQLLVNFTGEYVSKGQTLGLVYSPELVTAQQELLEAYNLKESHPALYAAAREKMRNWKLSEGQIDGVLSNGEVSEQFPIVADKTGFVLKRNVAVGDHVAQGESLFNIVDLSRVWVQFDVYEREIPWVRKGSQVEFTVQSLPGETFEGKISFIDPTIDPVTRVASARVEMSNPGQQLKPEMFATGVVTSSLGNQEKIVIPKSAVLWTGVRSVVYVKKVTENGVGFELHEVILGPALHDAYVVESGLAKGDDVVVNGAFTIDAAAQLAGKPSMMSPEGGQVTSSHQHGGSDIGNTRGAVKNQLKDQLHGLSVPYFALEEALVKGDATAAAESINQLLAKLTAIDMTQLTGTNHAKWMPLFNQMNQALVDVRTSRDIEAIRQSFSLISDAYFKAIQSFGVEGMHAYYQFCPMAFNNKGAYWISKTAEIKNPYFGSKMLTCGETVQEIK